MSSRFSRWPCRRRHRRRHGHRSWRALVLAEHGADVVLAGRRPDPLESTAKEVQAMGRRALAVSTDVTSMDCVPTA